MRRWVVLAVLATLGGGVLVWRLVPRDTTRARRNTSSRLDVAAFRRQLAERVRRAKVLVAHRTPERLQERPRSKAWDSLGKGPLFGSMIRETYELGGCAIGPRAICDALSPQTDACVGGDSRACIAIGQFLADTPPRIAFASTFFLAACRLGDAEGCRRLDDIVVGAPVDCDADPWACGVHAMRSKDAALHEHACALGVGDSCSMLAYFSKDPAERVAYYETSCQLGDTIVCQGLARLLSPDCEQREDDPCLPIDEEGAARAKAIACEAGFGC